MQFPQKVSAANSRIGSAAILLRGSLLVLVGAGMILAGCAVWAIAQFHSLHAAREYFRGNVLEVVEAGMRNRTDSGLPEIYLHLRNNAPVEISLVGARADCSCIEPRGLPLEISALSESEFTLALVDDVSPGFDRSVILYTNSSLMPELSYTMSRQLFASELTLADHSD